MNTVFTALVMQMEENTMITPSCDEIIELAKEYTTIPVCREIYADMTTPISLLRRLQTRSDVFPAGERGGRRKMGALFLPRL